MENPCQVVVVIVIVAFHRTGSVVAILGMRIWISFIQRIQHEEADRNPRGKGIGSSKMTTKDKTIARHATKMSSADHN